MYEVEELIRYMKSLGINISRKKALDFGCGVGRITQALTNYFDEAANDYTYTDKFRRFEWEVLTEIPIDFLKELIKSNKMRIESFTRYNIELQDEYDRTTKTGKYDIEISSMSYGKKTKTITLAGANTTISLGSIKISSLTDLHSK